MNVYEAIADEIEARIASGVYKPGEKIPSIRRMAEEFACNKLTVQKAYGKLRREGYLENVVGSGSFVRFPEEISRPGEIFDFHTSYISESFFPYGTAKQVFSDLFDREKSRVFSSPPVEGDPEFLQALSEFYRIPYRRMLIISGAQQGLDLIAKVFSTGISDSILFEDPTYPGAISLFKARHFVALEPDGPDLDSLDRHLTKQISLFYTMPSVHNPTGITYSLAKKEAVAERAERHPFYVIEDDYLSEFLDGQPPRFVDLFPRRTIYIKSLSQTTVSGIRLGFMVVPDALYDKFLYAKHLSDIQSTGVIQKFMREFIRDGSYQRYIEETVVRVRRRRARLLEAIASYPVLSCRVPQPGYGLWISSAEPVELPHVPWESGARFSFSPGYRNHFKVSFMHMDDATFEKALKYLAGLFERLQQGAS